MNTTMSRSPVSIDSTVIDASCASGVCIYIHVYVFIYIYIDT